MLPSQGPRPRVALALLLSINLFNYIDRYVLSAVLPMIEQEFGRSSAEVGFLASMFLLSYMVVAPFFGWLGDRMSRWWLIAGGVIFWSLASGGTGLAASFGILLLTRALIGVGEGAYAPVAPTIIADLFPVERRGAKLAWFYAAIPVGAAMGNIVGGEVAARISWRWAFYLVMPPGILLGLLCLLMREPVRGAADTATHRRPGPAQYLGLLKNRSYVLCSLGMTAMTFAFGAIAVWIPSYYYKREGVYEVRPITEEKLRAYAAPPADPIYDFFAPAVRYLGTDPRPPHITEAQIAKVRQLTGQSFHGIEALRTALRQIFTPGEVIALKARVAEAARVEEKSTGLDTINRYFGMIVVVTGLGATLAGGWLGDRLRPRWPGSYFLVSGIGLIVGVPFFWAAIELPHPYCWICVGIAVFFLFFNTGPANTVLANVTAPGVRSSAFALNILIIHLFGDVPSPPIVGWIDDHASLRVGLHLTAVMILLAALLWLWGARYLGEDTKQAQAAAS